MFKDFTNDLEIFFRNPRVPCHSMPQIDLSAWRENVQGCQIGNRHVRVGESAFPSPCTSCVCSTEGVSCEKYVVLKEKLLI